MPKPRKRGTGLSDRIDQQSDVDARMAETPHRGVAIGVLATSRGCRAPRRIMPELAAADSGLGNSVWQLRFARTGWRRRRRAALEQPGRSRQHPDRNTAVRELRRQPFSSPSRASEAPIPDRGFIF